MMYKNTEREAEQDAELEALQAEYRKQFHPETGELLPVVPEAAVAPVVTDPEDANWKKRHSDLRSYTSKQINDKDKLIADLQKELTASKDKGLPVNKTEMEDWVRDYPDLARVIGTMIDDRAERHVTSVSDEVKDVKLQLEAERVAMARERAIHEIVKVHSDFLTLVNQDDFKEWVESQPEVRGPRIGQALYDALYNNETDSASAIEAVNVYKRDVAPSTNKKDTTAREAATSVRKTTTSAPAATDGKRTYTESEIDSMDRWTYDKHDKDIELARREGRIVYDISGAAR